MLQSGILEIKGVEQAGSKVWFLKCWMWRAFTGAAAREAESSPASGLVWPLLRSDGREDAIARSGIRFQMICLLSWTNPKLRKGASSCIRQLIHKCWGPLCFQIGSQEALWMVQRYGLTLSSFTIRITICLWQSPVYPDSKQLERPKYQMLRFSFLLLNTRHSACGSPDKERS